MAAAVEDELHAFGVETTVERVGMDTGSGTLADPLRGLSDPGPFDTDALTAFEPAAALNGAEPATAGAFDCVTATALAAQSTGSTEPDRIAAHLPQVTSGDHACGGYPDCLDLLLEGEDIAYVGPRGPLRWDGPGAPSAVPAGLSGPGATAEGTTVGLPG